MEKPRVARIIVKGLKFYEEGILDIDFVNQTRVSNFDNDSSVYKVANSIYLPKYVGIVGINASGKTVTTRIISMVMDIYFNNARLSDYADTLFDLFDPSDIEIVIFYFSDNKLFKLESVIKETTYENSGYLIHSEDIFSRIINDETIKKDLYDDIHFQTLETSRFHLSIEQRLFLSDEESIISMTLNEKMKFVTLIGEFDLNKKNKTRFNYSQILNKVRIEDIQYLDASITSISSDDYNNINSIYTITRGNTTTSGNLETILSQLSSGTIRGLRLIANIREVLKMGGYLLMDELEVNLNTSIVTDIIRLFTESETNPNNASLIFSTHYIEILDSFERNDQILVTSKNKNNQIRINNYSDFVTRNDIKRSDAIFSDIYNQGTNIDYDIYNEFRKGFISNE